MGTNRRLSQAIRQALLLAVVIGVSLLLYLTVLKWRGPSHVWVTQTEWDRRIPFIPAWVWVYLLPYALGPGLAACLSRDTFWWYIRRALVAVLSSLVIFAVVPSRTVRPPLDDLGTGVTATFYRGMIDIDEPPANAAPSLHVSLTCLLMAAVVRDFPRWWLPAVAAGLAVCLATLLTHQHHLIDVATGALLAGLIALPWRTPLA